MIAKEELPDDPAAWGAFEVSLPRLDPDTEDSCPGPRSEIAEYVGIETSDPDITDRLVFIRTAQLDDKQCWIWSFLDSDGTMHYVTYWQDPIGGSALGMAEAKADAGAPEALSPEQFMLAEYYDLVYWS